MKNENIAMKDLKVAQEGIRIMFLSTVYVVVAIPSAAPTIYIVYHEILSKNEDVNVHTLKQTRWVYIELIFFY